MPPDQTTAQIPIELLERCVIGFLVAWHGLPEAEARDMADRIKEGAKAPLEVQGAVVAVSSVILTLKANGWMPTLQ